MQVKTKLLYNLCHVLMIFLTVYLLHAPLKSQQQRTKLAGRNLTFENPVHHYLLIVHKMKSKEREKNPILKKCFLCLYSASIPCPYLSVKIQNQNNPELS